MRTRDGLCEVEEPIEIAATWGDLLFSGHIDDLDWLTMRTCTVDLSGSASEVEPLDRAGLLAYSRALDDAFDRITWQVGRVEQREHEVRLDASLEARHTGPLDLSSLGGPTFPATGRPLRLPIQRFVWTIAHQRVLCFEVEHGPGLGLDLLARELELTGRTVQARKQTSEPKQADGNRHGGRSARASSWDLSPGKDGAKPAIEDLIRRAEAAREAESSSGSRGP